MKPCYLCKAEANSALQRQTSSKKMNNKSTLAAARRRFISALLGPWLSRNTTGSQGLRKMELPPKNHTAHAYCEKPFLWRFFLTWLITKVLNQFICRHPAPEDLATPKHLLQSCPFCPSLPCRYLFFSSPTGKTVAPLNIGHRTSIWAENHPLREHPIQKPLCKHCSPPTARQ